MKICSAGHGVSIWNDFKANGEHYEFWGCPKYKELKCKAKQVDSEDDAKTPVETREPIKERNFDEEARGKIRSLFIESRIIKQGLTPLTDDEHRALTELVEVAMKG